MVDAAGCLVCVGSGALGGAVGEGRAGDGGRLVLTYHARASVARALAARLPEAGAVPVDLASVTSVEAAVDEAAARLGGIDAFVQCAGIAVTSAGARRPSHPSIAEVDERGGDTMLDVNARSTFFAVRRVTAVMRGHGGGNVGVVGSIDGGN